MKQILLGYGTTTLQTGATSHDDGNRPVIKLMGDNNIELVFKNTSALRSLLELCSELAHSIDRQHAEKQEALRNPYPSKFRPGGTDES